MAFYIIPPGGNISLQKLTNYAVTRFKFLCKVFDTGGDRLQIFDILNDIDTVKDAECLIEGTVKDKVSHFILRLGCCQNKDMADFLVKAETFLFDFRFTCMSEDELRRLFKTVDELKSSCLRNKGSAEMPVFVKYFLQTMLKIKGDHSKWRTVIRNYLDGEEYSFKVPFWNVLHLVATRQVSLNGGIADVPICKLREVVTSLFEELLYNGIKRAAEVFHTTDGRIKILLNTIQVLYIEQYKNQYPRYDLHHDLYHTEVDDVVHLFPPCMSHLHRSLRMNHRLKHHSRIQYSLFLKEAGMSVHEALMFWRKEYSKSPNSREGCTHTWSKDAGRYTYNIRHLYGLEGSRINYRGHSCSMLQESYLGTQDSGGCPFSHFDLSHLLQLLHTEGITCDDDAEQILQFVKEKQFSKACSRYFQFKITKVIEGLQETSPSTPKQACRNCIDLQNTCSCQNSLKQNDCFNTYSNIQTCCYNKCYHFVSQCCDDLPDRSKASLVEPKIPLLQAVPGTLVSRNFTLNILKECHIERTIQDNILPKKTINGSEGIVKRYIPCDRDMNTEIDFHRDVMQHEDNVTKQPDKDLKSMVTKRPLTSSSIVPVVSCHTLSLDHRGNADKNVLFQKPIDYFKCCQL